MQKKADFFRKSLRFHPLKKSGCLTDPWPNPFLPPPKCAFFTFFTIFHHFTILNVVSTRFVPYKDPPFLYIFTQFYTFFKNNFTSLPKIFSQTQNNFIFYFFYFYTEEIIKNNFWVSKCHCSLGSIGMLHRQCCSRVPSSPALCSNHLSGH